MSSKKVDLSFLSFFSELKSKLTSDSTKSFVINLIIGIVFLVSISVIIGWFFDISFLKSVLPGFVELKFSAALAFLFSGFVLFGLSNNFSGADWKNKLTILFSSFILFLVFYTIITIFFNVPSIIEKTSANNLIETSIFFGIPSILAMFNFVLIALAGIFSPYKFKELFFKISGFILCVMGFLGVVVYLLNKFFLYSFISNFNSSFALQAAVLFFLIGAILFLLSREPSSEFNFTIRFTLLINFIVVIVLLIMLVGITNQLNEQRLEKTNMLKDVESPLTAMVEKVISYDAVLTGSAHEALLYAEKNEFDKLNNSKKRYDDAGILLDELLKVDAPQLLSRSKRSKELKEKVLDYLIQLDLINVKLVDFETRAFVAMYNGDIELARTLIVSDTYGTYKEQLAIIYTEWYFAESELDLSLRNEIISDSKNIALINFYFPLVIIIISLLISFSTAFSISTPLNKLKSDVDRITKGQLDIRLSKSSLLDIQDLTDSLNRILASMKLAILRSGINKSDIGIGEALTAKKIAEEKLVQSENKFKLFYESSGDAILTLQPPNWNFSNGNPAALKLFNIKYQAQLNSVTPSDLSPEKQPDGQLSSVKAKAMIEKALKDGSNLFEWTHKKFGDGEFNATVLLNKIQENDKEYLLANVRDITEKKKAEELLYAVGHVAKIGAWEFDVKTMKQTWTDEVYEIHEVSKDSFNPDVKSGINFYTLKSKPIIEKAVSDAISKGKSFDVQLEIITAKGNNKVVRAIGDVKKENGVISKVYGIFQDITEQQESESKFTTVADIIKDGIIMMNSNGAITFWNKSAEKIFGYKSEEVLGKTLHKIIPVKLDVKKLTKDMLDFKKKGKTWVTGGTFKLEAKRKNGHIFNIELSVSSLKLNDDWTAIGIVRDLSERK